MGWHSTHGCLNAAKKSEGQQPAASAAGREKRKTSFWGAVFPQAGQRWYLYLIPLSGANYALDVWGPLGPRVKAPGGRLQDMQYHNCVKREQEIYEHLKSQQGSNGETAPQKLKEVHFTRKTEQL